MYAGHHQSLFGDAAIPPRPQSLADVDYEALIARGRVERSRQFARLFDAVVVAAKRLFR